MKIITNAVGGVIQTWDEQYPVPKNCAIWPDDLDTALYYQYDGYVILQIEDGVVVGYEPDIEAWEAAQSEDDGETAPTLEDRVASLEENVTVLNIVLTGEGPTE